MDESTFSRGSVVEKFEFTYAVLMVEWSETNRKSGITWISAGLENLKVWLEKDM